jgi:hypothetical protein
VPCEVHPQYRVVIVGGEFGAGGVDKQLDEAIDVDAANAQLLDAYALCSVSALYDGIAAMFFGFLLSHNFLLSKEL